MSVPFEDPLSIAPDDTSDSALCHFTSVSDVNKNVVKSKSMHEKILEPEKIFDFLVWNHECDNEQADRIYEEMEKKDLRGYIYERDKIAGQYKLTAVEQAIRSTESIILLISTKALECSEFSRKMHASSNFSVIPVYIGLPKSEYPRVLRHHVHIQYKNEDVYFWDRLHAAITRPRKDSDSIMEVGNLSKSIKKEPSSRASPSPRKTIKPIKMVPGKSTAREKQSKKSPPSSKKKGLFSFSFSSSFSRSKQKGEKEMPSIQMETMRTNCEVLDDEANSG